jgi:hypothetical protein
VGRPSVNGAIVALVFRTPRVSRHPVALGDAKFDRSVMSRLFSVRDSRDLGRMELWRGTGPTTSAASSKAPACGSCLRRSGRPNANAYAERFVRSIREECLDRLILFGERRLLRALHEFLSHYHGKRNHQGLGNELITPAAAVAGATRVRCRDRLGGLLPYYHRIG